MPRSGKSASSADRSYKNPLGHATSPFLPHQGLPLLTDDGRVRWTARMVAVMAIFMAWEGSGTLLDRFNHSRETLVGIHCSRRRPGQSVEGFFKALVHGSASILRVLCEHWRRCVQSVAGDYWKIGPWIVFGVDGSKFDCPRTLANERELGVSGKNHGGPQQRLTCLFHIGSGILWSWMRGGICGEGEPTQLKQMLPLLPAEALLLADAGYTGYDLLKAMMERANSFVIRVGANVKLIRKLGYYTPEGRQTVYLWPLQKQGRNRRSMPRNLSKVQKPLVLRLIELKDDKGKPVFLVTNVLCKKRLSDGAAKRMYRLRWGIEVMWRGLKQTMGHHKLLSRTPGRCAAELDWAMAGLWMLQLLAVQQQIQSRRKPDESSLANILRALRGSLRGKPRRRTLAMDLAAATKDRYVRTGSKTARHFPKKREQKPPGAPEARMATDKEKQLILRLGRESPKKSVAA